MRAGRCTVHRVLTVDADCWAERRPDGERADRTGTDPRRRETPWCVDRRGRERWSGRQTALTTFCFSLTADQCRSAGTHPLKKRVGVKSETVKRPQSSSDFRVRDINKTHMSSSHYCTVYSHPAVAAVKRLTPKPVLQLHQNSTFTCACDRCAPVGARCTVC